MYKHIRIIVQQDPEKNKWKIIGFCVNGKGIDRRWRTANFQLLSTEKSRKKKDTWLVYTDWIPVPISSSLSRAFCVCTFSLLPIYMYLQKHQELRISYQAHNSQIIISRLHQTNIPSRWQKWEKQAMGLFVLFENQEGGLEVSTYWLLVDNLQYQRVYNCWQWGLQRGVQLVRYTTYWDSRWAL